VVNSLTSESFTSLVAARIARMKAEAARDQIANDKDIASAYVLAADTVVAVGRRILMKPSNIEEAANCLQLLSGRAHRVLYLARFAEAVYVLHVFEKRTRRTPQDDLDLARQRLGQLMKQRARRKG